MRSSFLERCFCQLYGLMLYTYPRQFRLQYGGEMQQLFRDRCRDAVRGRGRMTLAKFALHSAADWLSTTFREGVESLRVTAPALKTAVVHARAVWSAGRKQQPRSFVVEWALTILVYLFATTTLVQAYVVPTPSMDTSLMVGDHMLVDRLAFADPGPAGRHILPYRDVQRGDIVAFLYPEDIRQTYVKRVIGLPGDHIRMIDKQVVRNGQRLIEPYTRHIDPAIDPYRDDFPTAPGPWTTPRARLMFEHNVRDGELIVPPDTLFCMGDNRENSADSRYWGLVPRSYVVGKPLVVYWSFDAPTSDLEEWSLNHVVDVLTHFFTKTRWNRMMLVPRSQPAQIAGGAQ